MYLPAADLESAAEDVDDFVLILQDGAGDREVLNDSFRLLEWLTEQEQAFRPPDALLIGHEAQEELGIWSAHSRLYEMVHRLASAIVNYADEILYDAPLAARRVTARALQLAERTSLVSLHNNMR